MVYVTETVHLVSGTDHVNSSRIRSSDIKDCALYFVTHGQRPTLAAPTRQSDTLHLHQYAANSVSDPELSVPSVEEELL